MKSFILSSTLAIVAALATLSCSGKAPSDNAVNAAAEKVVVQEAAVSAVESLASGTIQPDSTLPVVIDFNATWCGPCRQFSPIFDEVAHELAGKALFYSVDVDRHPAVAAEFGVRSIPQISVLYPDGSIRTAVGFMPKADFLKFLAIE